MFLGHHHYGRCTWLLVVPRIVHILALPRGKDVRVSLILLSNCIWQLHSLFSIYCLEIPDRKIASNPIPTHLTSKKPFKRCGVLDTVVHYYGAFWRGGTK